MGLLRTGVRAGDIEAPSAIRYTPPPARAVVAEW
jgi:hypothetical protein